MSIERSINLAYGFVIPASDKVALDALSNHLLGIEYSDDLGAFVNSIYENQALHTYPNISIDTAMDSMSGSIDPALIVFDRKSNRSLYGNYEIFNAFNVNSQDLNELVKEKLSELLDVVKVVSPDITLDYVVWMSIS